MKSVMTSPSLRWQKIAGFALPMLMGWCSLGWMWVLSTWLIDHVTGDGVRPLIIMICLGTVPLTSHAMGIISAHFWQHQQWEPRIRKDMIETFSILFWIFSLPLTAILVCSIIGNLVIFIQVVFYNAGIKRGELWIKNRTLDKFLGRTNDWERGEHEQL